jgi:ribosomal protein L13E
MTRAERIKFWIDQLNGFVERGVFLAVAEVDPLVEQGEDTEAVMDARIQKSLLTLVKERLDAKPEQNQRFKATTDWKVLNQLLTVARVKELTRARIVKKGRGFEVDELSRTYYGRQVLDGLGFTKRRRVLDRAEFDKVKDEFQKIKLTLPEAVEPTTTEKYFALDVAP